MLDETDLRRILTTALRTGADWAEVYAETRTSVRVTSVDRRLEPVVTSRDRGVGIRAVKGDRFSYAYTNTMTRAALEAAAEAAAASVTATSGGEAAPAAVGVDVALAAAGAAVDPDEDGAGVSLATRVELVRRAEAAAWEGGADVRQVTVAYLDQSQQVQVVNSLGDVARHTNQRTRMIVEVVAARDGVVQKGFCGPGATCGTSFYADTTPESIGASAAGQALRLLDAVPIRGGEMPVVLAAGGAGVFLHEACGHGLEADDVVRGRSVFAATRGQRIGSELFSAVDDATLPGSWGSATHDDEGTPAGRTVLFDQGRQVGFLTDRLSAGRVGERLTGNGRRQSYAHAPQPRMTNSLILPGPHDRDAVVGDVRRGLYAVGLRGGEVDPVTGEFVFGVTEGYLIENGTLTRRVRGAVLVGNGPETLALVDGVCGDFEMRQGMCGKGGQWVPTAFGSPTLRIARITVGGTSG